MNLKIIHPAMPHKSNATLDQGILLTHGTQIFQKVHGWASCLTSTVVFFAAGCRSFQLTQSFLDHFGPVTPRYHDVHHHVFPEPRTHMNHPHPPQKKKRIITRGNQPEIFKLIDISTGYCQIWGITIFSCALNVTAVDQSGYPF